MTLGSLARYGADAVTNARLTPDKVRAIRRRLDDGNDRHGLQTELAREYGVTRACINDLARRKTWKWVDR